VNTSALSRGQSKDMLLSTLPLMPPAVRASWLGPMVLDVVWALASFIRNLLS